MNWFKVFWRGIYVNLQQIHIGQREAQKVSHMMFILYIYIYKIYFRAFFSKSTTKKFPYLIFFLLLLLESYKSFRILEVHLVHGYWSPDNNWGVAFLVSSSMAKTCRIPQTPLLLLFLALLLIASFTYALSLDFSSPKTSRTLLQTHEQHHSTMNLIHQTYTSSTHSAAAAVSATRKHREFEMAAHEVPSGPNPISNRWW